MAHGAGLENRRKISTGVRISLSAPFIHHAVTENESFIQVLHIVIIYEDSDITTQSLYRNMVIGTLGTTANLDELVKSIVVWKRRDSVFEYASADSRVVRRLFEKYS